MTIDSNEEWIGTSGKAKADALPQAAQDIRAEAQSDFQRAESAAHSAVDAVQAAAKAEMDLQTESNFAQQRFDDADPQSRNRSHVRELEAAGRDVKRAREHKAKMALESKAAIAAKHSILNPADIDKALADSKAQYFEMESDEFEEPAKPPKGKRWAEWLGEIRAETDTLRKEIKRVRGRPKTLREARQQTIPVVRSYLESRNLSEIRNAFHQVFRVDDNSDTRGWPAGIDISDGMLFALLKQNILDAYDRELNRLAERFGDRMIDAEQRKAELQRLNAALIENEKLDCRIVRAAKAAGVKGIYFKANMINPLHALNITPAAKQPARPAAPMMEFSDVPSGPEYSVIRA